MDTHPEFRRGLAGTLLHPIAPKGFAGMGAKDLVIVADQNYFAKDIYASVRVRFTERALAVEWSLGDT